MWCAAFIAQLEQSRKCEGRIYFHRRFAPVSEGVTGSGAAEGSHRASDGWPGFHRKDESMTESSQGVGPGLHVTATGNAEAATLRLMMLHGIYGRGRNWTSMAREIAAARPEWSALLVDLRLHGDSPAFDPPHTVEAAAADVRAVIEAESSNGAPVRALLGHSFGGKVTLAVAATPPEPLRQIWMIDASPGAGEPAGSAWDMLTHVRALPPTFAARADAIAGLEAHGWPTGVASWMATNLRYVDGEFRWTLDFDAMQTLLHSYFTTDLWRVIESPPPNLDVHVVKATQSNTVNETACARISGAAEATGRVHLHRVEGSHWLHTDNPKALVALLSEWLPRE
jgi:esterase